MDEKQRSWWRDPSKHSRDKLIAAGGSGVKGALLFACSPMDLSELLKEGTKESHDRAENTQFVKDFLKGRIKKELFKVSVALLPVPLIQTPRQSPTALGVFWWWIEQSLCSFKQCPPGTGSPGWFCASPGGFFLVTPIPCRWE